MIVLGIDPGFATLGYAVVDIGPTSETVSDLNVIRTKKRAGQGVLVTDDLHRRGQDLARELAVLLDVHRPALVCAESISYPRSAAVSAQIGRAWGILDALLEARFVALISTSPQAIKKACCGRINASKEEMLDALDARYGGDVRTMLAPIKAATMHEHPVDALGAVVAALTHEHFRLARAVRAPLQVSTPAPKVVT